jgi:hypothetical protein
MSEPMPVLPLNPVDYSRSNPPSEALRVLTVVLVVWGAAVTLRHGFYWANILLSTSSRPWPMAYIAMGLAMVEVMGYAIALVFCKGGFRGDLSAKTGLAIGAILAAAAVACSAGFSIVHQVMNVYGRAPGMNQPFYLGWQVVSELGKTVVPFTCGILILRLKPLPPTNFDPFSPGPRR